MHPLVTILFTLLTTASASPLTELFQRSSLLGGYAGGFQGSYLHDLTPYEHPQETSQHAVSHIRQQIYAASMPHVKYSPHASGYHLRTLHSPPLINSPPSSHRPFGISSFHPDYASSNNQPAYAASTYAPQAPYDPSEEEYYLVESEDEPVYFTEATNTAALEEGAPSDIYDTVMYARPNERGGYSYRRRPGRRSPPRLPSPYSRSPFIIKIHKKKVYID